MTDLFEAIRERVSAQDVAERYGLEIRRGKARCIWHEDKRPSLSFKGQQCKCFSCQSGGSAIDVAMQLFGLDAKGAAAKLNTDFDLHLDTDAPPDPTRANVADARRQIEEWRRQRFNALCKAERRANADLLTFTDVDAAWDDPRFVKALQARTAARTQLDELQTINMIDLIELHRNEVGHIDQKRRARRAGAVHE